MLKNERKMLCLVLLFQIMAFLPTRIMVGPVEALSSPGPLISSIWTLVLLLRWALACEASDVRTGDIIQHSCSSPFFRNSMIMALFHVEGMSLKCQIKHRSLWSGFSRTFPSILSASEVTPGAFLSVSNHWALFISSIIGLPSIMHDKYFIKDVSEEPADIRNTLSDVQMVSILQWGSQKRFFNFNVMFSVLSALFKFTVSYP